MALFQLMTYPEVTNCWTFTKCTLPCSEPTLSQELPTAKHPQVGLKIESTRSKSAHLGWKTRLICDTDYEEVH